MTTYKCHALTTLGMEKRFLTLFAFWNYYYGVTRSKLTSHLYDVVTTHLTSRVYNARPRRHICVDLRTECGVAVLLQRRSGPGELRNNAMPGTVQELASMFCKAVDSQGNVSCSGVPKMLFE